MAKKVKFPKHLYIAQEKYADGEESLITAEQFNDFAVVDEAREVALYDLVRVVKVKAKAVIE